MPFNLNGERISIEGLGLSDCRPVIKFPSGLIPENEPGRDLDAILTNINAAFGFNQTPHSFNTTWVPIRGEDPKGFHGASGQAPLTGRIIGFTVGDFLVSGEIIHSEYNTDATGGTIVSLNIQDERRCLDRIKIHTEDLGNNPGSGNISVARGVRIVDGFEDINGEIDEAKFVEYRKVLEQGCTYPQILKSIQLAIDNGELDFDINTIPTTAQLVNNIGGTASAIRFKFEMASLSEVMTTILEATAYDWYWSMSEHSVQLINRRVEFDLQENELLSIVSQLGAASGLDQTIRLSFGQDLVQDPRRVRLLGAHQEGFINSPLLSPIDGINTVNSGVVFHPAWPNVTAQFIDANGILRSYIPSDIELNMVLKGIEHWSYFKKYQTATPIPAEPQNNPGGSPGFGLSQDAGSIAAQHPDFQSRFDPAQPLATIGGNESGTIRLIDNRRDANQNWILAWFGRIDTHARELYGRAYVASGILANQASGAFKLLTSAWANIENQIEGQDISAEGSSGLFVNNYEINRDLSPLAPFKGTDDKIEAYIVLPSGTVYGVEGDDPPAGFGGWTEDYNVGNTPAASGRRSRTGEHYIPIQLREIGQLAIDPRDDLFPFESYPEGSILATLPIVAGTGLSENGILTNLVTLVEDALESSSSGLFDTPHPAFLIDIFPSLSGIAIPVQFTERYGMEFPSLWVSGILTTPCDNEEVVVEDLYAPWNFPPQGSTTSLQLMEDRAFRRIQGLIVPDNTSRYAQIELVGLPTISFDAFSNQTIDASGDIGVRNHGITDFNFGLTAQGITTTYKIASFFAEFGRPAPLEDRQRNILQGIITPIDVIELTMQPSQRQRGRRPQPPLIGVRPREGNITKRVTIETVNNALTFTSTPFIGTIERYRGITDQQYNAPPTFPGANDEDFKATGGAICVDGYLNLGDEAIYNVNEFKLENGRREIKRFFTGGRSFSNGTVVFVSGVGSSSNVFDVALDGSDPIRRLANVPLLNGAVSVGQNTTLVTDAQLSNRFLERPGAPLEREGIFLNPGGNSSIPVQVISLTDAGTSGAIATVRPLTDDGNVDTTAAAVGSVVPIPNAEFVIVGDKGIFLSSTVLDADSDPAAQTIGLFFMSNRQNFLKFT